MKFVRMDSVARIYNGNSINERLKAQNFAGLTIGTPYISTKDISYAFQVDYENGVRIPDSKSKEYKLAKRGSVLLCAEGGSAGRKMAIIDRDVFFVNKLFCFESNHELKSKYLFYYLQSPIFQNLFKNSMSGLIGGVSLEKVRNLPIAFPSLEKQGEIVEKLDSVFAEIENLETKSNSQVKVIKELAFQLIRRFLEDPLIESKRFHLDEISENLDSLRIPITRDVRTAGSYPYYGASGVIDYVDDFIFEGDALLVSEDGANLLARSTPIAFPVTGKYWVNNHAHILKFQNSNLQRFVEYFLESIKLDQYITGAAQPKLTQRALNSILIPVPLKSEDLRQIVLNIEIVKELVSKYLTNLNRMILLLGESKMSLLDQLYDLESS